MPQLSDVMMNIINNTIQDYIDNLVHKYPNLDKKELNKLWIEVSTDDTKKNIVNNTLQPLPTTNNTLQPLPTTNNTLQPLPTTNKCPYVFCRGASKGTICNSKPIKNMTYCSRHKKYEGTEPKKIKCKPDVNQIIPPAPIRKRIFKKNKELNCYWHAESQLVLNNAQERTVIGRVKNNKIEKLNDVDIQECKKWNLPYIIQSNDTKTQDTKTQDTKTQDTKTQDTKTQDTKTQDTREVYFLHKTNDNKDHKFWSAKLSDNKIEYNYGKIGKKGTNMSKIFLSHKKATAFLDKQINMKKEKGYVSKEDITEKSNSLNTEENVEEGNVEEENVEEENVEEENVEEENVEEENVEGREC
jgi:predicted DNA-binding WGR domain protein